MGVWAAGQVDSPCVDLHLAYLRSLVKLSRRSQSDSTFLCLPEHTKARLRHEINSNSEIDTSASTAVNGKQAWAPSASLGWSQPLAKHQGASWTRCKRKQVLQASFALLPPCQKLCEQHSALLGLQQPCNVVSLE